MLHNEDPEEMFKVFDIVKISLDNKITNLLHVKCCFTITISYFYCINWVFQIEMDI